MLKNVKNITTLLLVLFFVPMLKADELDDRPVYVNRAVSDRIIYRSDISSVNVFSISQDEFGIMWFGTLNGLNSFDGYSFFDYNNEKNIINSHITDIQPVGDSLFIGTEKGLSIFDLNKQEMTSLQYDFSDTLSTSLLVDNTINFISKPNAGKVSIGTKKGLMIFDVKTRTFYPFKVENQNTRYNVRCIDFIQQDSSWWAATAFGLMKYQRKNQTLHQYYHIDDNDRSLPDNFVNSVCCIDREHVFVGTKNGLAMFNDLKHCFEKIDIESVANSDKKRCNVTAIIKYGKDGILVGTYGDGLFYYNYVTKEIYQFSRFGNQTMSLSDNHISDVFLDNRGIVWIATNNGLNALEYDVSKFYTYSYYNSRSQSQPVWCFVELNPEEYFIGTDEGIVVFNKGTGTYNKFNSYYGLKDNVLNSLRVYSLFLEDERYLWIGTRSNGLFCFDIKTRKICNIFKDYGMNEFRYALVRSIIKDGKSNIWIATNHGLASLNTEKQVFKSYYSDDSEKSLPSDDIFDFLYKDDNLWITTGDGLARYLYVDDGFETFKIPDSLRSEGVKNNCLHKISDGGNGKFYIGSYSNGVVAFYPDTHNFELFSQKVGVSSRMVYSIVSDDDNNLWVSTNKGITKYNRDMKTFTRFDVSDGLQGNDFTLNASLKNSEDIMFFGGLNGFNVFNPRNIKAEDKEPRVVITSFNTPKNVKRMRLHDGDTVVLDPDENAFNIEFSAINLKKINKAKYRFFLENYDKNWTERSTDRHFAEYHRIPAGSYVFKLMASNEANRWNSKPFEITIVIPPLWYHTLWFRLSLSAVILMLIGVIIYVKISLVNERARHERYIHELEKQMYRLKQKSLQLQMNPHVLFNTLNSIQQYILTNDMDSAVRYLSSFSKLMRRILSNSNETYLPLFEEIEAIRLYLELEMLRFKGRFSYDIIVAPDVDTRFIDIAPMLIQPYVENAIVHGLMFKEGKGYLKLELSYVKEGLLLCVVEDNGIGRKRAEEIKKESDISRKSFGMNITKERMELLNKFADEEYHVEIEDLFDAEGKPSGTRVNIFINTTE